MANYYTVEIKDENITIENAIKILAEFNSTHKIRDFQCNEGFLFCSLRGESNVEWITSNFNVDPCNIWVWDEGDLCFEKAENAIADIEDTKKEIQGILEDAIQKSLDKILGGNVVC